MAKEVTIKELAEWIKKNEHHTWSRSWDRSSDKTYKAKYIRFSLDTRDMKIFNITTEGFGNAEADFRHDDKDWTILDLLSEKLETKK